MKERPILFSAPMVGALIAGTKTQTRRAIARAGSQCYLKRRPDGHDYWFTNLGHAFGNDQMLTNRYGQPGDRLWVRETHAIENRYQNVWCTYAADGHRQIVAAPEFVTVSKPGMRPSIHMPRWASRITLEVTGVRVERLQDISEADAKAEGAPDYEEGVDAPPPDGEHEWSYRASFRRLWESINGAGSWDANPWVWVVEFRHAER